MPLCKLISGLESTTMLKLVVPQIRLIRRKEIIPSRTMCPLYCVYIVVEDVNLLPMMGTALPRHQKPAGGWVGRLLPVACTFGSLDSHAHSSHNLWAGTGIGNGSKVVLGWNWYNFEHCNCWSYEKLAKFLYMTVHRGLGKSPINNKGEGTHRTVTTASSKILCCSLITSAAVSSPTTQKVKFVNQPSKEVLLWSTESTFSGTST